MAQQGADHPDFGLYAANQVQKGKPREGQSPERGVIEVKSADEDAWLTADSHQVSKYWGFYRIVLVTNTRDFVLVGQDAAGQPAKLETFRLAASAEEFETRLQHPRAFARDAGPGLAEYLSRALSHTAALTEPRDLARLLASYARDGLARVEANGDASSLATVRSALEEALGVKFEGDRAPHSSVQRWCRHSSTASSQPGSCGLARHRLQPASSTGTNPSGTCERRCCRRCSSRYRPPASCSPSASSSGPRLDGRGTRPRRPRRILRPLQRRAGRPYFYEPSSKPSTPTSASNSGSGTPPPRWSDTWSPASTAP